MENVFNKMNLRMDKVSPWVSVVKEVLSNKNLTPVFSKQVKDFSCYIYNGGESLWALVIWPGKEKMAFRLAYSPGDNLVLKGIAENENQITFSLKAIIGYYTVVIHMPESDNFFIRYTTSLKAGTSLMIPWWPRDIIPLGKTSESSGEIHIKQVGTRSGQLYMSMKEQGAGSILYLQNLTALNDYFQDTKTSAANIVGGEWSECGLALPATKEPLQSSKDYVISDAFVIATKDTPSNDLEKAKQFLELLCKIYIELPKREIEYTDWSAIVDKTLNHLEHNAGCWNHVKGHSYLNAYVADYVTPPEIMVQLAVLLPLLDYAKWNEAELSLIKNLESILPQFYDDKVKSIVRWLPVAEEKLDGKQEHKKPRIMDSWYLHHPLLNLSRMAKEYNNETAKTLFLNSLDFVIKIAQHFNYKWPVFYNLDTLEVIKAETAPGEGGEKDVAGSYAHIMLQAWEITNERRYLEEAKAAAKTLAEYGFQLFYQANNTAFAAGAMLRLWKETKEEIYRDLSYLCIANVLKNVALWDCNYGYAKHYSTFFSVYPLDDAPYTAVYEEQEVFAAFHDYLSYGKDEDILPSVSLLLAEFIRSIPYRSSFYYPCKLPKEMLSEKQESGELDHALWIPLEDLQDGWEKSGKVGQEVYGAGFACSILACHYFKISESFMIFIDYPTANFQSEKNFASFSVLGDARMNCKMLLIPLGKKALPEISVTTDGRSKDSKDVKGKLLPNGYRELLLQGNQKITVQWKDGKHSSVKKEEHHYN
jgi:hypothetical protein